MDIEYFKIYYP